jgi:hypothetical protein
MPVALNTEAELSAAVIAAQGRDWAPTMAVGSGACDLRVQLGRQPTAPVELNRGARRRRRDGDGANRYGPGRIPGFWQKRSVNAVTAK